MRLLGHVVAWLGLLAWLVAAGYALSVLLGSVWLALWQATR
jgi:hypothetical protein